MTRLAAFPLLLASLLLSACERPGADISREIARQFHLSGGGSVNLAHAVPGPWEEVCVLGPQSDNIAAGNTLGFDWNAEGRTSIQTNRGISLLVFVKDGEVLDYAEHPRADGDFSRMSGKCFAREEAAFVHEAIPAKGWSGLVSKAPRR
jgi:hypothetical protein